MKVAFAGSCQVAGLSASAHALRPDLAYAQHHVGATGSPADVRRALEGSDLIVTQIADDHAAGALLGPRALAGAGFQTIYLPIFVFRGLHPDVIYLSDGNRGLPGPVGPYHSLVVAAAQLLGLSAERTIRLLNAHVFAELGLARYEEARAATLASYAPEGFDLAPAFAWWEAAGEPFMHTINHPGIAVHAELSALVLARAELVPDGTAAAQGLPDPLADAVIAPVLPAVARPLGLRATQVWREAGRGDDPARDVPLDTYVQRARALYADRRELLLTTPAVRDASERLRALLDDARYAPPARSFASAAAR